MERMELMNEVADKVRQYLWKNVGNMTKPGVPRFDAARNLWRVPVLLSSELGIFPIGEALLDESLNFDQIPSKAQLEQAAQSQLRAQPVLVYADPDELRAKGFSPINN